MFNLFKKKQSDNSSNSPAHEDWMNAQAQFEKAEYSNALSTLIAGFKKDIYYQPLYELSGQCLQKMGGEEESKLFKQAANHLNANTFKQLGNHFYEAGHYPLTRIFLEEAFKLNKDLEVANNLAIAYARRFDTRKAQETLGMVQDKFDFWAYWFYVKLKILNNDKSNLDDSLKVLENAFDPNSQDENLRIPKQKVRELRESYERLVKLQTPEPSIRDWQFIQYGSVILNFFFSDDQYVAGGRHVASWGSNESIKSILTLLTGLLESKKMAKIVYANDRDSQIIGLALSKISKIPAEAYHPETTCQNALLLAADASAFNEFQDVEFITNNNITFSFNQNWLQPNYICPDIIGLMSQSYSYPWNGGNYKVKEGGEPIRTEPDLRDADAIAAEIANSELKEVDNIDEFYQRVSNDLKMNQARGHRYNFMVESPVPGVYFGNN
ncbi:MAG: hypothetical protein JNJ57_21850 [Saprospiraceae bacterium]|nr:hypothetical protein [Saprospiraceae bacterium]